MKFALAGQNIGHSLSPQLFASWCDGRWSYELVDCADFEQAWQKFLSDYKAINITAPFKEEAFRKALALADASGRTELVGEQVRGIGAANILVKTAKGIAAYNSDYLAVKEIISEVFTAHPDFRSIAVVGLGGAGKAAVAAAGDYAAEDGGHMRVTALHHDEIAGGLESDLVIFTLPRKAAGCDDIRCKVLLEANYRDPVFGPCGRFEYLGGLVWLQKQAEAGFPLMIA